ncbi:MAG: hypothetical protein U0174_17450 [Polyangiaceae bacterium]
MSISGLSKVSAEETPCPQATFHSFEKPGRGFVLAAERDVASTSRLDMNHAAVRELEQRFGELWAACGFDRDWQVQQVGGASQTPRNRSSAPFCRVWLALHLGLHEG